MLPYTECRTSSATRTSASHSPTRASSRTSLSCSVTTTTASWRELWVSLQTRVVTVKLDIYIYIYYLWDQIWIYTYMSTLCCARATNLCLLITYNVSSTSWDHLLQCIYMSIFHLTLCSELWLGWCWRTAATQHVWPASSRRHFCYRQYTSIHPVYYD